MLFILVVSMNKHIIMACYCLLVIVLSVNLICYVNVWCGTWNADLLFLDAVVYWS